MTARRSPCSATVEEKCWGIVWVRRGGCGGDFWLVQEDLVLGMETRGVNGAYYRRTFSMAFSQEVSSLLLLRWQASRSLGYCGGG